MERLVSVIIPTYNAAQYVRDAIDSVLAQTYADIEIIVVDDGSTDTTASILLSYEAERKIILITQKNKGPAAARNAGIQKARGEFVAFLDADDMWLSEKLALQIPCFSDPAVALVCGNLQFIGAPSRFSTYEDMSGPFAKGNAIRTLIKRNFIANSSVVIRASMLAEAEGFNEEKKFFAIEDYELYLRIAQEGKIACLSQVLGKYRLHAHQISSGRHAGYARLMALYAHLWKLPAFKRHRFLIARKYIENRIKSLLS